MRLISYTFHKWVLVFFHPMLRRNFNVLQSEKLDVEKATPALFFNQNIEISDNLSEKIPKTHSRKVYLLYLLMSCFCFYSLELNAMSVTDSYGLYLDWIDKSISPDQNFYGYANGNWQKNHPVPAAYSRWGVFDILEKQNEQVIREILETAEKDSPKKSGSITQKLGDFYHSGMDSNSIEKMGALPLSAEFEQINHIKNKTDLQRVIAHLQLIGVNAVFNFGQTQDFKNSQQVIGVAAQGGLGLPNRDYYLQDDVKFKQIRQVYITHIANMFKLLGDDSRQAELDAKTIMSIETFLAKASMPLAEQRDPKAIYHILNLNALKKTTPHFDWKQYFTHLNHPEIHSINLAMPNFFIAMDQQLDTLSLDDWKKYLRWHLIQSFSHYLSKAFVDESFRLKAAITGSKELLPRWQRVVAEENQALGFAIGQLYVEKNFPPSSKKAVIEIINNIRNALKDDLKTLSWMTPKTRQAALKKLALMKARVGYPEKWWDYSKLTIDRGPYVLNVLRANIFFNQRELNKIGNPVDTTEWEMTPQTVNAYYDPSMNNLNIPAGFLQPPFFDAKAPAAVNYGSIGFVIGHEMTHGFDDEGAQFDGYGNLKNWWSPEDLQKFHTATLCIINQFSQYKVDGNAPIQGKLVAGEAIADLGGFTLAYRALSSSPLYRHAETIAGYTPLQQFFLGAAHTFASNIRPEEARRLATVDPHPPAIYRINGSLVNMPEFQQAFKIPANSPMVKENRCVIW